jgi:HSP20 family protein
VTGHELFISGEMREPKREGVIRRQTRRTGRFEFRVTLPGEVDPEAVDAKLNDGVLTVRIPKAQRMQRRRIEVKSA